jgi:hypothetical protein
MNILDEYNNTIKNPLTKKFNYGDFWTQRQEQCWQLGMLILIKSGVDDLVALMVQTSSPSFSTQIITSSVLSSCNELRFYYSFEK